LANNDEEAKSKKRIKVGKNLFMITVFWLEKVTNAGKGMRGEHLHVSKDTIKSIPIFSG